MHGNGLPRGRPDGFSALAFWLRLSVLLPVCLAALTMRAENPCQPCHGEQVDAALRGPHRSVVAQDGAFCASCHGDTTRHLASNAAADILGKTVLANYSARDRSESCLSCHRGAFGSWEATPHARSAEVSCWSCHGNAAHEKGKGPRRRGASACASCHGDRAAEFRRVYHHPVPEGKMSCVSCHDVHGTRAHGPASASARCLDCHAEVAGPYVFPHRAQDDGCVACHAPHGSVNRSLVKTAGNGVCLTCHLQSSFPGVGKIPHNRQLQGGGKCIDCHSEVHGSNVDPLMAPKYRRR